MESSRRQRHVVRFYERPGRWLVSHPLPLWWCRFLAWAWMKTHPDCEARITPHTE